MSTRLIGRSALVANVAAVHARLSTPRLSYEHCRVELDELVVSLNFIIQACDSGEPVTRRLATARDTLSSHLLAVVDLDAAGVGRDRGLRLLDQGRRRAAEELEPLFG